MNTIPSEVILASAGTGKTHALTSRILRLLALGVEPDAVLALTFTRKAAGEFSSVLFRRLAAAAAEADAAVSLGNELGLDRADPPRFRELLARLVNAMDRLQFRTFDAFFQSVINAMPFDFGLPGGVRMLDEVESVEMRSRVLSRLLAAEADAAAQDALLAAYRDATWGAEEKGLRRRLEQFIESSHARFLENREAGHWGEGIWPQAPAWLEATIDPADTAAVEEWARSQDGEVFRSLEALAADARHWQAGMKLPKSRVFEQLLEALAREPDAEALSLTFRNRNHALPPSIVPALRRMILGFLGESVRRHQRITAGIHRMLDPFDTAYHAEVRLTGRLAFADVVEMLRQLPALEWQARLDARVDHWLFDEFQDTSLAQWHVVENVVDEVLQDDSGRRSAFFVGDPKQSIYRWRGGEHRLIEQILDRYGAGVVQRSLVKSYRSDPAVIELVNHFGSLAAQPACGLPADVVQEWGRFWESHESAAPQRQGHSTVHLLQGADELPDRVLAELARIDPVGRGLTCAVLTRDNDEARNLAAALRERSFLHVTAETDELVASDAPVNRCLLALVSALAHPADSASRSLVEMSPLRAAILEHGWPAARTRFFADVARRGLEPTLRAIVEATPGGAPVDAFSRQRLRLLLALARRHDAEGGTLDDFLDRARAHGRRQAASAGTVQILTIHRSKGLGFDIVLLPVLDTTRMDAAPRETFLVHRGRDLGARWLLHRPVSAIAEADASLGEAHRQQVNDAAYDELCVWYVALTRAKHSLHVFTVPPAKSGGPSPVNLLHRAVASFPAQGDLLWEAGDPAWFQK
jgi:ATP-dependent exoDNAse (exonuclease V) beta subunit